MMRAWQVVALAVVLSGCGYALAGKANNLPKDLRRIGIPLFQNQTTTPDIDRLFTDAVRAEFQQKGNYSIVADSTGVDAVLIGTIRSVNLDPAVISTGTLQASKNAITVLADVEFKITKDGQMLCCAPQRFTDYYDVASGAAVNDLATLFAQNRNALDRLAQDFARSLVQSILSGSF